MIFVRKLANFQSLFISGKKSQENAFYDILDIKNAFIEYKNITL